MPEAWTVEPPLFFRRTSPGFTYESPTANNLYIYDTTVSSGVSPTASQRSGRSITAGALIEAS